MPVSVSQPNATSSQLDLVYLSNTYIASASLFPPTVWLEAALSHLWPRLQRRTPPCSQGSPTPGLPVLALLNRPLLPDEEKLGPGIAIIDRRLDLSVGAIYLSAEPTYLFPRHERPANQRRAATTTTTTTTPPLIRRSEPSCEPASGGDLSGASILLIGLS